MENERTAGPATALIRGEQPGSSCLVMTGTSGYSYLEWVDSGFYPPGTTAARMLGLYGRCFSIVELNYTWYQMARADALARMAAGAPPHMRFAAKLSRSITHEREDDWAEQVRQYRHGISPLGDRLLAVLVQLPPGFERTVANRCFLAQLLDALHGLPVAVEFRHLSWATDSVFGELERRQVSLVNVDEPALPNLFPATSVVTNPQLFYVRFHGRNEAGWRSSNMQKKFDYDYTKNELEQWDRDYLQPMRAQAEQGIIFFNNHVRAQAPRNAQLLGTLLEGGGCAPSR